ncbi:MAG TPA: hypothetical protein VGR91_06765 [Stellaceae bacterium]|nr:hypothetical protein [Stellaceae bacterium]
MARPTRSLKISHAYFGASAPHDLAIALRARARLQHELCGERRHVHRHQHGARQGNVEDPAADAASAAAEDDGGAPRDAVARMSAALDAVRRMIAVYADLDGRRPGIVHVISLRLEIATLICREALTNPFNRRSGALRGIVGLDDFREVPEAALPGIFDARSWAYWNLVCDRRPAPPLPVRSGLAPRQRRSRILAK